MLAVFKKGLNSGDYGMDTLTPGSMDDGSMLT